MRPKRRGKPSISEMFSATVIQSIRPRSWWMNAIGQAAQRVRHVAAAIGDGAGVERVDAGEDLDERRFAGAVLAEQRDDLAGADVDARIDERLRAAELFRHAAHCQQGRSGLGCRCHGCPREAWSEWPCGRFRAYTACDASTSDACDPATPTTGSRDAAFLLGIEFRFRPVRNGFNLSRTRQLWGKPWRVFGFWI